MIPQYVWGNFSFTADDSFACIGDVHKCAQAAFIDDYAAVFIGPFAFVFASCDRNPWKSSYALFNFSGTRATATD